MDEYSGMFLRQYMGQTSMEIPNVTDAWLASPDLLVYGTAAAYTTDNFNSTVDDYNSRTFFFSQPPTPGVANYIYLRAMTLSPNTTCTVYLYYCEAAALLQPAQWQTGTFTVAVDGGVPVNQNTLTLSGVNVFCCT